MRTGSVVRGVNSEEELGRAVSVFSADSVVTIRGGFVFNHHGLRLRLTHAVLSVNRDAAEGRSRVSDHVVVNGRRCEDRTGLSGVVAEGRAEGGNRTNLTPGRRTLDDRAQLTESNLTEAALNEQRSFTIKERVGGTERTVVNVEAAFKDEADLGAVTQIFNALEAPAGTGLVAGLHFKLIGGVNTLAVLVKMRVDQTGIDHTIERDISSESRTGESAENSDCSNCLFHNEEISKLNSFVPPV